jgi:hypothetical protein
LFFHEFNEDDIKNNLLELFEFIGTASKKKHSIELQDSILTGFLISFE